MKTFLGSFHSPDCDSVVRAIEPVHHDWEEASRECPRKLLSDQMGFLGCYEEIVASPRESHLDLGRSQELLGGL